jgi:hypothetical protein
MIIKLKSKHDIRQEMESEIVNFISAGGEIKKIDRGLSGRETNQNLNQSIPFTEGGKQERTLLTETVKLIDERKQNKKPAPPVKKQPKNRIIYDDFGEVVREVWE